MKKTYDFDIIKKFFKGFEMEENSRNIVLVDGINYEQAGNTALSYNKISISKSFYNKNSYAQNLFNKIQKRDYVILFTEPEIYLAYIADTEKQESKSNTNDTNDIFYYRNICLFYELQDIGVTINKIISKSIINYKDIKSIKNLITITYNNQSYNIDEYFKNIVCKDCKNTFVEDILYTLYVEKMIVGKDNCKEEGQ